MIWTLIRHECRLQLYHRFHWLLMGLSLSALSLLFYFLLQQFESSLSQELAYQTAYQSISEAVLHPYLAWLLLFFLLSAPLSQRHSLAEEQRFHTLDLYRMKAIPLTTVLLAKMSAHLLIFISVFLLSLTPPLSLLFFGQLDLGQFLCGALGVLLVYLSGLSFFLLCSAYSRYHFYAALSAFMGLSLLIFLEWLAPALFNPPLSYEVQAFGFLAPVKNGLNGLCRIQDFSYPILFTLVCGFLSFSALQYSRIKQLILGFFILFLSIFIQIQLNKLPYQWDWSLNRLNSLQRETQALLDTLTDPLTLELYLNTDRPFYEDSLHFLKQLKQYQPKLHFTLYEEPPVPHGQSAKLHLRYKDKEKILDLTQGQLNEIQFYQGLYAFMHNMAHWVVFTQGHGEPSLEDNDTHAFSHLCHLLKENGASILGLDLAETGFIPDNTQVLVIAANRYPFSHQEQQLIQAYLEQGNHLLWLLNPETEKTSLAFLQTHLNFVIEPEPVLSRHPGLKNPYISLVKTYSHPALALLKQVTVFPYALALQPGNHLNSPFTQTPFLSVQTQNGSQSKPIGLHFSREIKQPNTEDNKPRTQRIVVIGNSQFLSNAGILLYGNRLLAQYLMDYLAENEAQAQLIPKPVIDPFPALPTYAKTVYREAFPIGFLFTSLLFCFITAYRRKRNRLESML